MMHPQSQLQTPLHFMTSLMALPNFRSIDLNSLSLHPYYPTPHDFAVFRAQTLKLANNFIAESFINVKHESPVKFESKIEHSSKPTKVEPSSDEDFNYSESSTIPSQTSPSLTKADLKQELERMIRFLLYNMGKDNEALIKNARSSYLHNPSLLEVFDKISMRYYGAKKCKEDLIRFILRKIFRHIRTSIMRKEKVTSKKAALLLCKRYFQTNAEPSEFEDEEKFLESLMPYNKNSKNKTMNITFILEIFSSPDFCKEYEDFLPKLNALIVEENKKKEKKMVGFILDCIEKNCLEKLGTLNRFPWLDVWTEDAKNLAIAIMPNKRLIYNTKKIEDLVGDLRCIDLFPFIEVPYFIV